MVGGADAVVFTKGASLDLGATVVGSEIQITAYDVDKQFG